MCLNGPHNLPPGLPPHPCCATHLTTMGILAPSRCVFPLCASIAASQCSQRSYVTNAQAVVQCSTGRTASGKGSERAVKCSTAQKTSEAQHLP